MPKPKQASMNRKITKIPGGKNLDHSPTFAFSFCSSLQTKSLAQAYNLKTRGLMDLQVNTLFCSKHYTMPH